MLHHVSADLEEAQRRSTSVQAQLQRQVTHLTGRRRSGRMVPPSQVVPVYPKVTLSSPNAAVTPRLTQDRGCRGAPSPHGEATSDHPLAVSNDPSQRLFDLFEDESPPSYKACPTAGTLATPLRDVSNVSRRSTRRLTAKAT
eukprot:EG_transcript_19738